MGAEGLIPTTKEFGTALGDIVRCAECAHMQLDRFPRDAELDAAYEDAESDAYVEEEAGQRYSFASVLERIERYAPERGAILDVGCWVGFLLAEAAGARLARARSESSRRAFASEYARERLGLDVRTEELFTADLPSGALRRRRHGRRARAPDPRERGARPGRRAAAARRRCWRSSCPTPAAASPGCSARAGGP